MGDIPGIDINTILGIAIAYLINQVWRWVSRTRFWSQIAKDASNSLSDPNIPINDPLEAAEQALVTAQRPRLRKIADSIAPKDNKEK